MNNWFEVDKDGLAKILARKGKQFILFELLQNAWDQNVKKVFVKFRTAEARLPGSRWVGRKPIEISVMDDDPDGFENLKHAYTLFAESEKKSDPNKRGRFNLGEKLVLAVCEKAQIQTTKGTVVFDKKGRTNSRKKRDEGSEFKCTVKMSKEEFFKCIIAVRTLIPPKGIKTFLEGEELKRPKVLKSFTASLPTEISDAEGQLKQTVRKTEVEIFNKPIDGKFYIYEMGIPVVETDIGFQINIMQKIPLNMDRDNVKPSYAKTLKAIVLNEMSIVMNEDQFTETWVNEALESPKCSVVAAKDVLKARHGDKIAVYDPTDPESKNRATAKGYHILHGRTYSKKAWEKIRETNSVPSTSEVAPTPEPYSKEGKPLKVIPETEWTKEMKFAEQFARIYATHTVLRDIQVKFVNEPDWGFMGTYGDGMLTINIIKKAMNRYIGHTSCGEDFMVKVFFLEFLNHELAHEYETNHLSDKFHQQCCHIGAMGAMAIALGNISVMEEDLKCPLS